jgi:uncharacterized membrane protein HdeD (DUF308 family)
MGASTIGAVHGEELCARLRQQPALNSKREHTMTTQDPGKRLDMGEIMRQHWKALLIEGILLVVLGLLAIALPLLASIAITLFLGWLFLISGIAGLILTIWARQVPGFWWSIVSALLSLAAGVLLIGWPGQGVISLTLVLGVFFVMEGVASIMYALEHRRELSGRWGWMVAAGILDIVIAGMIITGLPGSAGWAIGLLVGINLVFGGATLIGMAASARST